MGDFLVKILILEYVVIGASYAWERDYPRVLYFTGAVVLSLGVLLMGKR